MATTLTVVIGPTSSGKSKLAIEMATQSGAQIISADAFQVYRGLSIGTGKTPLMDRHDVPHHLIDIREPIQRYCVSDFMHLSNTLISTLHAQHIPVIVCGGTAFYLHAFIHQLGFESLPYDESLRASLTKTWSHQSGIAIWQHLYRLDPSTALAIPVAQSQKVLRALEVWMLTGKSMISQKSIPIRRKNCRVIGLNPARELLIKQIYHRIESMIENGWVEEVEVLLKKGIPESCPAFKAIGYKEIAHYLNGGMTFTQMIESIKTKTRQFSKRQMTWFKHFKDVEWIF